MRYRLMATYRGVPYEAGIGPGAEDVVLFAACPPPEELGFEPATGHWRKELGRHEVQALWESKPTGTFHGDRCMVLDDLGDRLHIAYLGHDAYQAEQLGYWEVDRGVFEMITPRSEVTDIVEERADFVATAMSPAASNGSDGGGPGVRSAGPASGGFSVPRTPRELGAPRDLSPPPSLGLPGDLGVPLGLARPRPPASERPLPLEEAARLAASARLEVSARLAASAAGPEAGRMGWPQEPDLPPRPTAPPGPTTLPGPAHQPGPTTLPGPAHQPGPTTLPGPGHQPGPGETPGWAESADPDSPRSRRHDSALRHLATQRIFTELAGLAAIPPSAFAVGEEVDGAMCLIQTPDGFEVFNSADGARHEVRLFDDEESAYFYLFGVLVAEAVRTGRLIPQG
jgi:hypothetical protein